jgi:hypothetical protein
MEVGEQWTRSLGTIGPLPADKSGSTYIMVAIDGLSRFVVLEPASDASGESVARFLRKLVAPVADQRELAGAAPTAQ